MLPPKIKFSAMYQLWEPHIPPSKGVIRCRDLEGVSEEEICQHLSSQDVTSVRRIKVRLNNELLPTNTFVLTFNVPIPTVAVSLTMCQRRCLHQLQG